MGLNARDALKIDEPNLRRAMMAHVQTLPRMNEAEKHILVDRAVKAVDNITTALATVLDDDCNDSQRLPVMALACRFGSDMLEQLGDIMAIMCMGSLSDRDPAWLDRYLRERG